MQKESRFLQLSQLFKGCETSSQDPNDTYLIPFQCRAEYNDGCVGCLTNFALLTRILIKMSSLFKKKKKKVNSRQKNKDPMLVIPDLLPQITNLLAFNLNLHISA